MKSSGRRAGVPVVLTIAGSDSGGGAGIQADLKTFMALGAFGTSAITCITAQNPDAVTGLEPVSAKLVARQIKAVTAAFPVAAAKTGMLFSAAIIQTVARALRTKPPLPLVVDPVMIATSGARLLREDAVSALCRDLLPMATVVTPNLNEAEVLAGCRIRTLDQLKKAALLISKRFGTACVAKGGHLAGRTVVDVLCADGEFTLFTAPRIRVRETHGTGCTFSAALAAALAQGADLPEAVAVAKCFVSGALRKARVTGQHVPLNFSWQS
jgi:hydroxymethylpyrimidine/phosphomethylpyrimidine kinase